MDMSKETGKYVIVYFGGKDLLFVECPFCKAFSHITGAKKKHKVHLCYKCDTRYMEP
jgi:hypothetical protein